MPGVAGGSSSSKQVASAAGFDLRSQQGVADLLRQVRSSALPAGTKSQVRELVLRYTQGGGDPGVREELEQLLGKLHLSGGSQKQKSEADKSVSAPAQPEPSNTSPSPASSSTQQNIGSRRVPVFAAGPKASSSDLSGTTPTTQEHTRADEPNVETPPSPAVAPLGAARPKPSMSFSPTSVKDTPAATEGAPQVENQTPPPVPQPAPAPEPESKPAPAPAAQSTNHLARIQEIKKEVIALVGNPVNLVDIDNAVGRQYMTALLEAMKKSNGGTAAEASAAMADLENAFVAVQGVARHGLADHAAADPVEPKIEVQQDAVPDSMTLPVVPEPAPIIEEVSEPPTPEPAPAPEPPVDAVSEQINVPVGSEEKASADIAPTPAPAPQPPTPPAPPVAPTTGLTENLASDSAEWAEAVATDEQMVDQAANNSAQTEEAQPTLGGSPLHDIPSYGYSQPSRTVFAPIHAERPLGQKAPAPAQPEPQPTVPPVVPPVPEAPVPSVAPDSVQHAHSMGTDLMSPNITAGLSQLLSEWKIFKSSGLFGMGPGGIDHPLFQKIKNETMIGVTGGTFDGATPEIQQSINDYINGWRYEQNIFPQHSETFEHFLRRVVKKVLGETKK